MFTLSLPFHLRQTLSAENALKKNIALSSTTTPQTYLTALPLSPYYTRLINSGVKYQARLAWEVEKAKECFLCFGKPDLPILFLFCSFLFSLENRKGKGKEKLRRDRDPFPWLNIRTLVTKLCRFDTY